MNKPTHRYLTIVLSGAVALSVVGVIYISVVPPIPSAGDEFTEFYLLDSEGTTENYPQSLAPNEDQIVTIGIVNHEAESVAYRVEVHWNDTKTQEMRVVLENEERWEQTIRISAPDEPGKYRLVLTLNSADENPAVEEQQVRLFVTVHGNQTITESID